MPNRRVAGALGAAAIALLCAAAPAVADDSVVVDFETGPPLESAITEEYRSSAFVFFQRADAQRPARRSAPGKARSGSVVANVGADRCVPEGGTGNDCEFPVGGTVGRLTRTASSVKLYAGLFEPTADAVTVQLRGLRANGTVAATGAAATVTAAGFTTEVAVQSAAADIARFEVIVDGPGDIGAGVGFDDLTLLYPSGSLPDVSLSVPPATVAVPQGGSVDVPVTVTRLNGSTGPVDLSAAPLPAGVTVAFVPDPVPGTTEASTLRLTAAPDAPRSPMEVPEVVTLAGEPGGDGAVAQGRREVALSVRVASPYDLRATGASSVALPSCTTTEVPLRLERDRTFGGTVRLAATGLPPGVSASFSPGPEIPPGGGFFVDVVLRLTTTAAGVPTANYAVEATSPGAPTRRLALQLRAAAPTASLAAPATGRLAAPQLLRPGTSVRLDGNGLCPGTKVRIGTAVGEATTDVAPDGRSLTFATPRLATSGAVTVVPPVGAPYPAGTATVSTFRSTKGLAFGNFDFGGLSLGEAADVFGLDELFITLNPCWPFSDCPVPTPIPDPTVLTVYVAVDRALRNSGGHCFGITRAVQGWMRNPATLNRWTSGPNPYDIAARTGALDSYLDGQHAVQASAEFISAFFSRQESVSAQLATIRSQLTSGNPPSVSLRRSLTKGHVVLAYDIVDKPDGTVDVLVYDNNIPFTGDELTDLDGSTHSAREEKTSLITFSADRRTWTFKGNSEYSGGGDRIFATPYNVVPSGDLSLPGGYQALEALSHIVFGAEDGSARTEGPPPGADFLPPLDETAPDGVAGVIGVTGGGIASHTVRGVKPGRYVQAVLGGEAVGGMQVSTAPGVRDTTSALRQGDGVAFTPLGRTAGRALRLDVSRRRGEGESRLATVTTRTFGGGKDVARLDGAGTLRYAHDGAATSASFILQGVRTRGGGGTFASGPLRIGPGETLTARPASWLRLDRVRATIRGRGGRTRTVTLRNRAKAPARLSLGRPRLSGRRASATVRIGGLPEYAGAGVVLRAVRGSRTLARRGFALPSPKAGARTVRWTLPRAVRRGRVRLVADATLTVGGARSGTVRRRASAAVRVR